MDRGEAWQYVQYGVNDALAQCNPNEAPDNARLVGWLLESEGYIFVAVWSYMADVKIEDEEAISLATDLLVDVGWFESGVTRPRIVI